MTGVLGLTKAWYRSLSCSSCCLAVLLRSFLVLLPFSLILVLLLASSFFLSLSALSCTLLLRNSRSSRSAPPSLPSPPLSLSTPKCALRRNFGCVRCVSIAWWAYPWSASSRCVVVNVLNQRLMPAHLIVYLLGRERPTNDPFVPYICSLSVCGIERGND